MTEFLTYEFDLSGKIVFSIMTFARRGGCCGPFGGRGGLGLLPFVGPWGGGWGGWGGGWGGWGGGGWGGGPNVARASISYPQVGYGGYGSSGPMMGGGPHYHYHHDRHRHFY